MAGLLLFSLASLAGGFAPSGLWFIVARAVQGLGAGLVAPAALSLITTIFDEGPARNRAFGLAGSITSFGFATGALLGGLLVAGPGWRWVMFVNVPVGMAAFLLAPLFLEKRTPTRAEQQPLDLAGAVLVTTGLIVLVYTLAQGEGFGWLSWQTLALGALALVLLAAFVLVEERARAPLVRLGIFRLRTLTGGNLVSLLCSGAFVSLMFVLTLYMQRVLGYAAITTGLAFLPLAVMIMLISNLASRLVTRVGVKSFLVGGMGIFALGLLFLTRLSVESTFLGTLLPGMLIVAIGAGCVFPCLFIAGTAGVSANEQGLASGLINTSQQVGGSLGLALVTTIAAARTSALAHSGTALDKAALVEGFDSALFACLGFAVAAALLALLVIRDSACRDCIAACTSTEHYCSARPFALHLGHLGRGRAKQAQQGA